MSDLMSLQLPATIEILVTSLANDRFNANMAFLVFSQLDSSDESNFTLVTFNFFHG